jgi:phosphate acetyltransferase
VRADEARALEVIVTRYRVLAATSDAVLAVGTDFAAVGTAGELAFNARVALNLGLPVLAWSRGTIARWRRSSRRCRWRSR